MFECILYYLCFYLWPSRLLMESSSMLADWYFENSQPVTAACCHLAVNDVQVGTNIYLSMRVRLVLSSSFFKLAFIGITEDFSINSLRLLGEHKPIVLIHQIFCFYYKYCVVHVRSFKAFIFKILKNQ